MKTINTVKKLLSKHEDKEFFLLISPYVQRREREAWGNENVSWWR